MAWEIGNGDALDTIEKIQIDEIKNKILVNCNVIIFMEISNKTELTYVISFYFIYSFCVIVQQCTTKKQTNSNIYFFKKPVLSVQTPIISQEPNYPPNC